MTQTDLLRTLTAFVHTSHSHWNELSDTLPRALEALATDPSTNLAASELEQIWYLWTKPGGARRSIALDQLWLSFFDEQGAASIEERVTRAIATLGAHVAYNECRSHTSEGARRRLLDEWIGRAFLSLGCRTDPVVLRDDEPLADLRTLVREYQGRVRRSQPLSGEPWRIVAAWLAAWATVANPPNMIVPLVGVSPGAGFLAQLRLWKREDPVLVPHPRACTQWYTTDLLDTVAEAWDRAGRPGAAWAIDTRLERRGMSGTSHGGAVAAAFQLLRQDLLWDPRCVITASLHRDDRSRLIKTEHEQEKVDCLAKDLAADRSARRVWNAGVATGSAAKLRVSEGIVIHELGTVEAAARFAHGLENDLRTYLECVAGVADQPGPPYLGSKTLAQVNVYQDVLYGVKRENRPSATFTDERGIPGPAFTGVDLGDDYLYGAALTEYERREPWLAEVARLEGGETGCLIVRGAPGSGKSHLVAMTARDLAQASLKRLIGGASCEEVAIPIVLSVSDLVAAPVSGNEPAKQLRESVGCALRGLSDDGKLLGETFIKFLLDRLQSDRVWLLLDALDEFHAEFHDDSNRLQRYFVALSRSRTRLIIASRPHRYQEMVTFFRSIRPTVVDLAPFTPAQVTEFLALRFAAEPDGAAKRTRVEEAIEGNSPSGALAAIPFLLTLLCWLAETAELSRQLTRSQLYDRVVERFLRASTAGDQDGARALERRRYLGRIALAALQDAPGLAAIPEATIRAALGLTRLPHERGSNEARIKAVIADLEKTRLITRSPAGVTYLFPHRSFGEFLAACGLEELI